MTIPLIVKPRIPDWVLLLVVVTLVVFGTWGLYLTFRAPKACARAGGTFFSAARGGVCVRVVNGKPTRIDP